MSDLPTMTPHGTFIINGVERVIVPQLARSFGVFFTESESKGKRYFGAKIIPARGVWIEIESESDGGIYVRVDKKRKFPVTLLLRALGFDTNEKILKAFGDDETLLNTIKESIAKDNTKSLDENFIEIYKRLRDGDMASAENAREFVDSLFIKDRYDLSPVGRYRFNQRFGKSMDKSELERRTLSGDDVLSIVRHIITLNNDPHAKGDDIDHLGQH
jgi:DNA-directed RNA polymerase subunit beta